MAKHFCDGKIQGKYHCSYAALFRVEWATNPSGLPGLARLNRNKACALHMGQVVKKATAAATSGHVHILPVTSDLEWWAN